MNWKQAFLNTVKSTEVSVFVTIVGYIVLFELIGKVIQFFGLQDNFLTTLIIIALVIFIVRFSSALIQEKNKK